MSLKRGQLRKWNWLKCRAFWMSFWPLLVLAILPWSPVFRFQMPCQLWQSTIEARFGKQINVSKRGTIYIGKKRGRKPRINLHTQQNEHKASDKQPLPISSPFENPLVPSNTSSTTGMPSPRVMHSFSSHSAASGTAHPCHHGYQPAWPEDNAKSTAYQCIAHENA